jgi:hypothetical protein
MPIKLLLLLVGFVGLAAVKAQDSVVIVFETSSVQAQEYTERACFIIKAAGDFRSPFDITVECTPGSTDSATPGDDYNADPITVRFTPNRKSQTVCVPVVNNDECERSKRFVCDIRRSSLPVFGTSRGRVRVNIVDSSRREDDCQATSPPTTPVPPPKSFDTAFTIWGKSACPNATNLVYQGRAVSGYYNHYGGGGNFLCLTEEAKYNDESTLTDSGWGYIYGTEYQIDTNQALTRARHDQNVPCATCTAPCSKKIMMPGTNMCPDGWTKLYYGWLMGGYYNYAASTSYICVDVNPDVIIGEGASQNGALLHHIQVDCGYGIPCPPYDERRELSCVVCCQ